MPMCWPSQTMRSPGLRRLPAGGDRAAGALRPVPDARRPRRSPGPARRAARRPAWPPRRRSRRTTGRRRCPPWRCGTAAMRGESLEPGGCSVCPTSAWASGDHARAGRAALAAAAAAAGRGRPAGRSPSRRGSARGQRRGGRAELGAATVGVRGRRASRRGGDLADPAPCDLRHPGQDDVETHSLVSRTRAAILNARRAAPGPPVVTC